MSAKKIVYILQNRICPRLFLCRFNESTIKWRVQCCCCCLFTQFPRIDPEKWEQFQLQLLVLWNQCLYCGLKTSSYKTSIAKKVDFFERTTRTYNMLEQVVVPKCQQFFLTKNERTTVSKVEELFSQMGWYNTIYELYF